uniref:Ig-like domain-containing protein n=1 Tax=Heliothis virescens TaxID=7102 RepID=A0A2A4JNM7_HELVI
MNASSRGDRVIRSVNSNISGALTRPRRDTVRVRPAIDTQSARHRPAQPDTRPGVGHRLIAPRYTDYEELRDNLTVSVMSFVPTLDDDGKPLTCRADNPNVTSLSIDTSWTISVVYPPVVRLRLGSSLAAGDIKEGDDVYFECHVRANPPARKLSWLHDDRALAHNATARVFHSNQSLVLQKVTRHSSGRYACSALNAEGETVSNELLFRVKYAPSCRTGGVSVVGAARGESVVIVCEVDADPPAAVFKWKFNNSGETLDVAADRYTSNGSASSLKYTPVADLDYGTLSCSASNEVGTQLTPCVFQMVAAGKPHAPRNCTLWNQTADSVEVSCVAGFDGGLPQRFLLEVYSDSAVPRVNLSSEEPSWTVRGLEWDVRFRLVALAYNSKGRSPPARLDDVLFRDPEKRTVIRTVFSFSGSSEQHVVEASRAASGLAVVGEPRRMGHSHCYYLAAGVHRRAPPTRGVSVVCYYDNTIHLS